MSDSLKRDFNMAPMCVNLRNKCSFLGIVHGEVHDKSNKKELKMMFCLKIPYHNGAGKLMPNLTTVFIEAGSRCYAHVKQFLETDDLVMVECEFVASRYKNPRTQQVSYRYSMRAREIVVLGKWKEIRTASGKSVKAIEMQHPGVTEIISELHQGYSNSSS